MSIWNYYNVNNGWPAGTDENGVPVFNHWTSVVGYLKSKLNRSLSDQEITEISLSLGYGPTPVLTFDDKVVAMNAAHPNGNHLGLSIDQDRVKTILNSLDDESDAAPFRSLVGELQRGMVMWFEGDALTKEKKDSSVGQVVVLYSQQTQPDDPYKRYWCRYL